MGDKAGMTTRRAGWLVAAILALAAAAAITFTPVTVNGVDCGTPFAQRDFELVDGTNGETVSPTDCNTPASQRRTLVIVLTILGGVTLASALAHAPWTDRPLRYLLTPSPGHEATAQGG